MKDAGGMRALYETIQQNNVEDYARIIQETASYPYLYHLSEIRQNLIDWLPITDSMHVLERNAECGALTAKLIEKAGSVTALVEDSMQGDIVRARCQNAGDKLRIVMEEEWHNTKDKRCKTAKEAGMDAGESSIDTDDSLAHTHYDMIILVGSIYRYRSELPELCTRLKPEGVLILADTNRLGLKYFAGSQEEYRGGYFSGIEGYTDAKQPKSNHDTDAKIAEMERCYSKSEYRKMLKEAGFAYQEFYYPYPDYKFPASIYSDEWLPKKGELAENRRNFDRDRLQLFDESKAYDSLISEGLFGAFANSYLIVAGADKYKKFKTIYTKYSNERAKQYCIRTDIVKDESGEKEVYKYALSPESEHHIRYIEDAYRRLTECYKDSGITFCECAYEEKECVRIRFPFVSGCSLQDMIEQAILVGDDAAVEEILREYIRRIRSYGGEEAFVVTPEFTRVFGDMELTGGLSCAAASDVDMIFGNIFVDTAQPVREAVWQVIDYEWTFTFPIPKLFILYRGIYFAYYQILQDTAWTLPALLELAGITEAQAEIFKKMEVQFQSYLGTGTVPVRNMQRLMGTKVTSLKELLDLQKADMTQSGMAENAAKGNKTAGSMSGSGKNSPKIRKIIYNIDRREYQDGSVICSGWALAKCWNGTCLPVEIRVLDETGKALFAQIERTERQDAIEALGIRKAATSVVGFDCVWIAPPKGEWKIQFSLGNKECIYKMQE